MNARVPHGGLGIIVEEIPFIVLYP